jgi:hypothetical protein
VEGSQPETPGSGDVRHSDMGSVMVTNFLYTSLVELNLEISSFVVNLATQISAVKYCASPCYRISRVINLTCSATDS